MAGNTSKRFLDIDVLRGLAMAGMIVYHAAFVMDFYGIRQIDTAAPNWTALQRVVQFIFIGLVGVSMKLSKKTRRQQIKRGIFVFGCGMLVTLATYIAIPEYYVRFGILHFIGTSIVIMSFFKDKPKAITAIAVVSLIFGQFVSIPPVGPTVDYFPIFPWISLIAAGMLAPTPRFSVEANFISRTIGFLGRHSLILYFIHVPAILGILLMWKKWIG